MQKSRQRTREQEATPEQRETRDMDELEQRITDELDEILADVDEVLQQNAEEFLAAYVQKNGQ